MGEEEEGGETSEVHWTDTLKRNWPKIVGLLILVYVAWYIWDWLGCSGGDTACGIMTDLLGNAGRILLGQLKGCEKQADCSKYNSDKSTCSSTATCAWHVSNGSPKDKSYCYCTTGYKPGQGGLLGAHCLLGWGALAWGILVAMGALAAFASKYAPDWLKDKYNGKGGKNLEALKEANKDAPDPEAETDRDLDDIKETVDSNTQNKELTEKQGKDRAEVLGKSKVSQKVKESDPDFSLNMAKDAAQQIVKEQVECTRAEVGEQVANEVAEEAEAQGVKDPLVDPEPEPVGPE